MSASLNKVMLIGNLCQDPEVRSFTNGGRVCNLRIATNETWKDKQGQRQERAEYHTVAVLSDGLVKVCENYLRKGSKVFIEGQLQTRKWSDQQGNDRYSTEIVLRGFGGTLTMLDGKGDERGERKRSYDDNSGGGWGGGNTSAADDLDDEIPGWD